MRIEIPSDIKEYFKDLWICYTYFYIDQVIFLYEDSEDCLEFKIKKCDCIPNYANNLNFFDFKEEIWGERYRNDSDLEAYTIEEDRSFFHPFITRYDIKLYFEGCTESNYSFYYYSFCSNCYGIDISIKSEKELDI